VIHVTSKTHSRIATIIVSFNAGSRVEPIGGYNSGIAHMLEHSLFKGTAKRNSVQLQREIAFLGGHSNAFTSHESVAYYITVPYENLEPCVEILADMVFNPIFPEDEFLKEKEVVKEEEISSGDDPTIFIWQNFSKNFFDNYISVPVIGTQESIDRFTCDEVKRFHSQFCQRKDAVVSLCSNLNKKQSKELLRRYFGKPNGKIKRSYSFDNTNYADSRYLELVKDGIEHTYAWMGMPAANTASEWEGAIQVLMTIMGRGMDCRLFTEVREKRGLVYGISTAYNDWEHGALSLIELSTRQENIQEAVETVDAELSRIKMELPTEEEVQRAKNKMRSSFYSAMEDSYSICYWAVKRKLFGLPDIEDYMKSIESVSASDVTDAANMIFDETRQLFLTCRGREDGEKH
jgi:predicted Zn-dependent peptidase